MSELRDAVRRMLGGMEHMKPGGPYLIGGDAVREVRAALSAPDPAPLRAKCHEVPDDWGPVEDRPCVTCPGCGFTFAAEHTFHDGTYGCPECGHGDESEKPDPAPEFYTAKDAISDAVNLSCTCGGHAPDEGACPACMVWHRLQEHETAVREYEGESKGERTCPTPKCCGAHGCPGGTVYYCKHAGFDIGHMRLERDDDGSVWLRNTGTGFVCARGHDTAWVARDGCAEWTPREEGSDDV